jgi:hypothetical protein
MKSLSVEEIMARIKAEVEKRKQSDSKRFIEFNYEKKYKNIIHHRNFSFQFKEVYEYSDFTKYHDKDFIVYLYKALLKREPDEDGLNYYLELLRTGKKSKTEIISIIRYSKEGREKNVKLLGSKKRYLYTILISLPVFGYILKTFIFFVRFPKYLERMNILENYIARESRFNYENGLLLENELNEQMSDVRKIKFVLKQIKEKL